MEMDKDSEYLSRGRMLQIEAEKLRKRGDLVEAGRKIAASAIMHLKAICIAEDIPCEEENQYFRAASEIARRFRHQNINKQFGEAMLMHLNGDRELVHLTGDQIKTYFKDVQKFIHLIRERVR